MITETNNQRRIKTPVGLGRIEAEAWHHPKDQPEPATIYWVTFDRVTEFMGRSRTGAWFEPEFLLEVAQ